MEKIDTSILDKKENESIEEYLKRFEKEMELLIKDKSKLDKLNKINK